MKKISLLTMAMLFVFLSNAYAGNKCTDTTPFECVTPDVAYQMVMDNPHVYIVDVRTDAEWIYLGHPGVNKAGEGIVDERKIDDQVINISYKITKAGSTIVNPSFLTDINGIFGSNPDVVLITMCRSGSRSFSAATDLYNAGYTVINMIDGFEGDKDWLGYRTVNGWKNLGLTYNYSGEPYAD